MRKVFIAGVGMTQFAKHMDKSIKVLAKIALERVIADAGVKLSDVEAAWFSNSGWGFSYGQDCIRGQVALKPAGLEGIPITNVENACAGGSTGLHHAWLGVASGLYECALAIGAEKGYLEDKEKMFKGFWSGFDVENAMEHIKMLQAVSEKIKLADDPGVAGKDRSAFMDIYSAFCRWHMEKYGTTQKQVAIIASKDHFHSSMNPYAQFQKKMSVEEILAARLVSWPLTVPMCAPIGDVMETRAIKRIFGDHAYKIMVSSNKSIFGHCLGAAGGLEAAATVMTIERDEVPPTINLDNPDPECDLDYVANVSRKAKVDVAISNSFGFGGHNAAIVFSKFRG